MYIMINFFSYCTFIVNILCVNELNDAGTPGRTPPIGSDGVPGYEIFSNQIKSKSM